MIVNFTKMHGLGNDFVVIDLISQGARLQKPQIRRIADRKFGIGCDQIILITPPTKEDADFFYRIFNADGEEVEQCGNGARCAAKFFTDNGLSNRNKLIADCLGGRMTFLIDDDQRITVNLGKNYTAVSNAPLNIPGLPPQIYTVSTGNPHGVLVMDDIINSEQLETWGKQLTNAPMFPQGANISFMQVVDRKTLNLRVYERGVGPSLACGSAACAAMLVGRHLNLLDNKVYVQFEFGDLIIEYSDNDQSISMTGPATSVFIGRFRI
jgi:diaminopimelate epimerase